MEENSGEEKNDKKKKIKDYRERLKKLQLTRKKKTETFKIIHGISNYGRHFFNISSQTGNLLTTQISKTKSVNQLDFFC